MVLIPIKMAEFFLLESVNSYHYTFVFLLHFLLYNAFFVLFSCASQDIAYFLVNLFVLKPTIFSNYKCTKLHFIFSLKCINVNILLFVLFFFKYSDKYLLLLINL